MKKIELLLFYLNEAIDEKKLYKMATGNQIPGKDYTNYTKWKAEVELSIRIFLVGTGRMAYIGNIHHLFIIECDSGMLYISDSSKKFIFGHWYKNFGRVYDKPLKVDVKKCNVISRYQLTGT